MIIDVWVGVGLSLLLGALIGVQREMRQQQEEIVDFAGFRSYIFISILGYLFGFLGNEIFKSQAIVLVGVFFVFFLSIVAYRAVSKLHPKEISITNEVVLVLTFLIGILVSMKFYYVCVTLSILITGILYLSEELHKFAKKLKKSEFLATLKFVLISAVILPILPNKNYTPLDLPLFGSLLKKQEIISSDLLTQLDVFNFFHIWLFVVLISAIGYVGYILMKTIGAERGVEVTGFLGGFMSSTALTSSFALESKRLNYLSSPLIIGTVIACSTMFLRIIFEVWLINPEILLYLLLPMVIMGAFGYLIATYLLKKSKLRHIKNLDLNSPFTLVPALKFAIFFLFILIITKLFTLIYGEKGIFLVAFFSGIADVDAITISLSNLASTGIISASSASTGIILAAFANTFFKAGIAYFVGSKAFSKGIIYTFLLILFVGFITFLFF